MTGAPGVFAGGDMVPGGAHGHGRRRPRQARRPRDRRVAARRGATSARPKHPLAPFESLNLWFFGDALRRQQPELEPDRAGRRLRRGRRRAADRRRDLRGAPLPVVRQLLRVRRLRRRLPGGRGDQARPGLPLPVRLRPLHGLPGVLRAVPGPLDRDDPGGSADPPETRSSRPFTGRAVGWSDP